MTKKELLDSRIFQQMPDDTELVFNTNVKAEDCIPVTEKDLSFRSEIVGWAKREITGGSDPIVKRYIVININPC